MLKAGCDIVTGVFHCDGRAFVCSYDGYVVIRGQFCQCLKFRSGGVASDRSWRDVSQFGGEVFDIIFYLMGGLGVECFLNGWPLNCSVLFLKKWFTLRDLVSLCNGSV